MCSIQKSFSTFSALKILFRHEIIKTAIFYDVVSIEKYCFCSIVIDSFFSHKTLFSVTSIRKAWQSLSQLLPVNCQRQRKRKEDKWVEEAGGSSNTSSYVFTPTYNKQLRLCSNHLSIPAPQENKNNYNTSVLSSLDAILLHFHTHMSCCNDF